MNQYADLPSPDQEVARDQTPVKSIPRKFRSESQKPESPDQNAHLPDWVAIYGGNWFGT